MDKRSELRENQHREAEDIEIMYHEHRLMSLVEVVKEAERRRDTDVPLIL